MKAFRLFSIIVFTFFSSLSFGNESLCAQRCFETIDEACKPCRVCESCEDTTPRGYVKNLEKNIGDLLKNKITKNQQLNNIYEKSKRNLFKRWGIDPNKPLPKDLKVPYGVLVRNKQGKLEMSMNAQLAREILRNSNGEPELIDLGKSYLSLMSAGHNIDYEFRKHFKRIFGDMDPPKGLKYKDCFHKITFKDPKFRKYCFKINEFVNEEYFNNKVFSYQLSNDNFRPDLENSAGKNSSLFFSPSDEGVNFRSKGLLDCAKQVTSGNPFKTVPCNCERDKSSLIAFEQQIKAYQELKNSPEVKYFDLMRVEALRKLFLNYSNATGVLPDRKLLKTCEKAFGHSLNNVYSMGVNEFNPDVSRNELRPGVIAKRNRAAAQQINQLAEKAKFLFEVKKEQCDYDFEGEQSCSKSKQWKENEPKYKRVNQRIQALLNEFPLAGDGVDFSETIYDQILDKASSVQSIPKMNDNELALKRKKILEKKITDSMNRFCTNKGDGITNDQLLEMKDLKHSVIMNYQDHNFYALDLCLQQNKQTKDKAQREAKIVLAVGCAGISITAGALTFFAGGAGGVATAVGLGCFSVETSAMYSDMMLRQQELSNIEDCMISSPDFTKSKAEKICGQKSWSKAQKRYEDAAADFKFQMLLSPLEIIPVVGDIVQFRRAKTPVSALLKQRDVILDGIEEARKLGNSGEVLKLENDLNKVNKRLLAKNVTPEDLANHYRSQGVGDEIVEAEAGTPKRVKNDSQLPATMDDPNVPRRQQQDIDLSESDRRLPSTQDDPNLVDTLDGPNASRRQRQDIELSESDRRLPATQDDPNLADTLDGPNASRRQQQDIELSESDRRLQATQDDPNTAGTLDDPNVPRRQQQDIELSESDRRLPDTDIDSNEASRSSSQKGKASTASPNAVNSLSSVRSRVITKLSGVSMQQLELLKQLDLQDLMKLEKFLDLGGDYESLGKKLLSATYSHPGGDAVLPIAEIKNFLKSFDSLHLNKPGIAKRFSSFLSKPGRTLHSMDEFFATCVRKKTCESIMSSLDERIKVGSISSKELMLMNKHPGPYLEFYIPMAKNYPLGDFVGKGAYGAVFCIEKSAGKCSKVIKIPLLFHPENIYEMEHELSRLYLRSGDRAAQIHTPVSQEVMIKTFIEGEEAADIIGAGRLLSKAQEDDVVTFFRDMYTANMKNPRVQWADIKANNLRWDVTKNKWVFVDTGARYPRSMFSKPEAFFDTFGRGFFFPGWLKPKGKQLADLKVQWQRVCRRIMAGLSTEKRTLLNPACTMP